MGGGEVLEVKVRGSPSGREQVCEAGRRPERAVGDELLGALTLGINTGLGSPFILCFPGRATLKSRPFSPGRTE